MHRKFGRKIGWTLKCRLRCWTHTLQNWLRRFWRHFASNSKKMINCIQLKEIARFVPEIPVEYFQILKEGKILGRRQRWVSALRSCVGCETWRDWLGTFWRCLRDCSNARVQRCGHETVEVDLGRHRQVCGPYSQENSIETLCVRAYKTKKQGKIQRALPASQLFSAMPPLGAVKVLLSIMMFCEFVEQREYIEVETLRHQQSTFPRNRPETHLCPSSSGRDTWRRQKLAEWSRACVELRMLPTSGNLTLTTWT